MFDINNTKSKKEIFVNGIWIPYESRGEDTEKSREFYRKAGEVPFIQGSFPSRIDGVIQSVPTPNCVFYRKK
jgi:hypothetical protein